ncbi:MULTISPECIES: hypothetical protein [Virgibacillus]|uniref:Integral membrane protein n=2 Tax=Virgibacillus TaxID=84406 RepID=A0A024QDH3_9BACI|nr:MULTISPECIES: hypothetical protein [Virgibacillus]EQB36275.1 hypothetical protein M948_14670 [Virgibacillus sp. CM-4]MYL42123.1 hypothetical protein [Virgibacillus massiliensis]GGJ45291.1 hypothetical protein GCM10007111_04130 [Virgibacillus kapii]CDQ39966.1 hypothetical protein BN990_02284 [Virgibacillus massiliensis]
MDWIFFTLFIIALMISVILIIFTLVSLTPLGDERKNFIKMKTQSYTFAVVIGYVLIELFRKGYLNIEIEGAYEGINPFTFLVTISIVYLISLLFFKKKYGG